MSNLSVSSPLMQPVSYNGQTYYTSQYFHALYLQEHNDAPKKYRQHKNFVRMLESIESYGLYVERGDVAKLVYEKAQAQSGAQKLSSLFKLTSYNPITLINATFQLELTHHLDDEISKQMAYTHSAKTAQESQAPTVLPEETALRRLKLWMELAALCEAPKYIALIEGAKHVQKTDGIDLSPLLQLSTALDSIPDEQVMLEPTEIGKRLGLSGADVNRRLQQRGVQARIDGEWRPTDAGKEQCYRHAWHVGEKSGFNLKWNVEFAKYSCLES